MELNATIEQNLQKIKEKDPDFYSAICDVIGHLSKTYDDKYAKSDLDTKGIIYSNTLGKGYCCGNATKYIQRYITSGFSKSENPEDLKKSIHYLLFELTRRAK